MLTRLRLLTAAGLLAALGAGCGDDSSAENGKESSSSDESADVRVTRPATPTGLENLFQSLVEDMRAGNDQKVTDTLAELALPAPDTYFETLFESAVAKRVNAGYREQAEHLGELTEVLRAQLDKGRDRIAVERFDDPDDPRAVGFQSIALVEMKEKTPLYSVRLLASGEDTGFHVWSFVHDGEAFRWVGKLRGIREGLGDEERKKLELRREMAQKIAPAK